jgi:hypothetical protein
VPSNLPPPSPTTSPVSVKPPLPPPPKHKPLVKQRRRRGHDVPEWMSGKTAKLVAMLVVSILMLGIERFV